MSKDTKGEAKQASFTGKTVIERSWNGFPDKILRFPVSLALSGDMANERETTIGLSTAEKAERLLDFRTRLLADVLTDAPTMIDITEFTRLVQSKEALKTEIAQKQKADVNYTPTAEELEATRITQADVNNLSHFLPGWEEMEKTEKTPLSFTEKAREYFAQTDEDGRKVFQLLIEDIIAAYWEWATPRPTISVSAFMQDKPLTFTGNSGS